MKLNFKQNLGFTLVELLVVIAIIGILSSVAVVNLNSTRDKAKQAVIKETLASIRPIVILCFSSNENIYQTFGTDTVCNDLNGAPTPDEKICNSVDTVWPELQNVVDGWSWSDQCNSVYSTGVYSYSASNGVNTVTCSEAGCVTT